MHSYNQYIQLWRYFTLQDCETLKLFHLARFSTAKSTNSQNSDFLQRAFFPSAEEGQYENEDCEDGDDNGDDTDDDQDDADDDDDSDDVDDDDDYGDEDGGADDGSPGG